MRSDTDHDALRLIDSLEDVAAGVAALARVDGRFARLAGDNGLPDLRRRPPGLESLLFLVTEQQISLTAAAAIWSRFAARFAPFDPEYLSRCTLADYRACGQSLPKARAIGAIATAVASGQFDLDGLARLDDDAARRALTGLHGIGPWTAEVYLLSCLGRADAWPSGDVALQRSAGRVFNLGERPDAGTLDCLAEPWRPWRAVAARLLWAEYRRRRFAE